MHLSLLPWLAIMMVVCLTHSLELEQAKMELQTMLNTIHQRFSFQDPYYAQMLYVAINIKDASWDIIKLKFLLKILQKESFIMVSGGSSVTAGHDNYYNQSYPFVFERRLSRALQLLGVTLSVRNIAQGGNDCLPSNLCYGIGSSKPDWISWEQSFNCGRAADIFELISRYAGFHRAIMFFMASGGASKECPPSTDPIPVMDENWTPSNHDAYSPTQNAVHDLKETLNKNFEHGNPVGRFTSALGGRYPGVAAHGK